ncbi:hypothetical protein LGH70_20820 [Hymenobacter sp. BT635]|uniref:Uncharacterized protein n=1 Tax=Hymenobacter nitidus TaxID=2880929 RepID=A0ABS8AIF9_9BACT|nr:hypothetical protein [Hymenobacter nitidus]MCB2380050.1 hypothetical protein [Hymenobacter nitidus]
MKDYIYALSTASLVLLWGMMPQYSVAQGHQGDTKPASSRSFDFSVPASPAFVTLGVSPENVVRPISPRLFAASLADAIDQSGRIQSGVAIDAAPFMATTTLQQYRESSVRRFFANTQFSLGTTKGQSSVDEALQGAVGIHFTLLNTSDPRLDSTVLKFYDNLDKQAMANVGFPPDARGAQAKDAEIARLKEEQATKFRQAGEQGFVWTAAAALSSRSDSSRINDLEYNGFAAWTSLSYGLGTTVQGIVHVRGRWDEKVANTNKPGDLYSQNSFLAGLRLRGSIGSIKTSLEGAATFIDRDLKATDGSNQPTDVAGLISAVIEPRLTENLWLHLSLYSEFAKDLKRNGIGFKTALKWGVSQKD